MRINRPSDEVDRIDQCVCALAEVFNRKPTDAMLVGYQLGLLGIDVERIEQATVRAIQQCPKFMPTPAELRELAGEIPGNSRSVVAWQAVLKAVPLGPYKHVDFDDPTINAVIRFLGGWPTFLSRFSGADEEKWARQEFCKAYDRMHAAGVNGEACDPLPGLNECTVRGGKLLPPIPERVVTGIGVDERKRLSQQQGRIAG